MSKDELSRLHSLLLMFFEQSTNLEETIAIHVVLGIVENKLNNFEKKGGK